MMERRTRWVFAALGGILAGVGGCATTSTPPAVPGAPTVDPAGVPAAQPADVEKPHAGEKHACASNGSCGAMPDKNKKDDTPTTPRR
jgi:hypothetical protein